MRLPHPDTLIRHLAPLARMRRPVMLAVLAGALALAGVAIVWALTARHDTAPGGGGTAEGRPGVPVIVRPLELRSDAARIEAVGTGRALRSVTLYPEAAGLVREVRFRAGQRIEAGTPLLRLDDEDQRLAVELARVELEGAARRLARYERVVDSGAVSASEVEQASSDLDAARIALSRAELALERRTLVAPFDGVVGIPEVDVGDRVTSTTRIANFDDRGALLVDFEVPEAFSAGIEPGDPVRVGSWARSDVAINGTVEAVSSQIDPDSRTLRVRARIPNPEDRLRPGMSFLVRIGMAGERFPAVPSVALLWDRRTAYVWRIVDGAAERVDVRVLRRGEGWVLVDAPLAEGDLIVVEGVQRLRPGTNVRVQQVGEVARAGEESDGD